MHAAALPKHDVTGPLTRALEAASLAAAAALVVWNTARVAAEPAVLAWWLPAAVAAGALAADLASGLVHWAADTWGRESLPFLGPRFLRPFRVHHVNPDDILERGFVDLNGDVALLACPVLIGAALTPLGEDLSGALGVFLTAFGSFSLPTNQVHRWAHEARPPRFAVWLQSKGLILSREAHQKHHAAPHTSHYCIATGWCNEVLEALRFFPALETAITALFRTRPRSDEAWR